MASGPAPAPRTEPPATREASETRLRRLLGAAAHLADPNTSAGSGLRARLSTTTGLSRAGIELAFARAWERDYEARDLDSLLRSAGRSPRAHVLLSANVFVAALRAIALAVVGSNEVLVRASRREPAVAQALHALLPDLFSLVDELAPAPGETLWAYGADETLRELRAHSSPSIRLRLHGHGFGAVVVAEPHVSDLREAARAIASDVVLFDQRGCLSPRLVCVRGSEEFAQALASQLAVELAKSADETPRGERTLVERAEQRRAHDAALYAFCVHEAGPGFVSESMSGALAIAHPERNLHVARVSDPLAALEPFAAHLTCIGLGVGRDSASAIAERFPGARLAELGFMQRPPLDGPVDLRGGELPGEAELEQPPR